MTIKHSRLRSGILAFMTFFIYLAFLSCPNAIARIYSTGFPLSENPLSDGGNWVNGTITGTNTGCAATNTPGGVHYAYGLQSGTNGPPNNSIYDDSLACLTGTWGPTQSLDITIYLTNQLASSANVYEEIEYGLRCTLTTNGLHGYFIDCSLNSDSGYVELGLSYGNYSNTNWGADRYGAQYVVHNGSKIHAAITNNTISVSFDGVLVLQSTDTTGLGPTNGGAPLIGFFHQNGNSHQTDFGISSFTATDGINNGADQLPQPPTGMHVVGPLARWEGNASFIDRSICRIQRQLHFGRRADRG